jgi:hypothetical protein
VEYGRGWKGTAFNLENVSHDQQHWRWASDRSVWPALLTWAYDLGRPWVPLPPLVPARNQNQEIWKKQEKTGKNSEPMDLTN